MEVTIDVECPHCDFEFERNIDFDIRNGLDDDCKTKIFICPKCTCEFQSRFSLSCSYSQSRNEILKEPIEEIDPIQYFETTESTDPNQLKLF